MESVALTGRVLFEGRMATEMIIRVLNYAAMIMVMTVVLSFSLLFIGIGVLVLSHICVVGRVFRRGFTINVRRERTGGLLPEELERLPCYDHGDESNVDKVIDCVVCLESFQMGDRCRLLPACGHSFHALCIDSWLTKTRLCPICRQNAAPGTGKVVSAA